MKALAKRGPKEPAKRTPPRKGGRVKGQKNGTGPFDSPLRLKQGNRFSKEAVAKALEAANGLVSVAARRMGCSVSTVKNYLERFPDLRESLQEIRDSYIDLAESSLLAQIKEKNTSATIFLLKCLGKKRGYIELPQTQLHVHAEMGSGTWADIMKREVQRGGGVIDIPVPSRYTKKALVAAAHGEDEE